MKKALFPLTLSLYIQDVLFILIGNIEAYWLVYCFYGAVLFSVVFALLSIILAIFDKRISPEQAIRNSMIFKLILVPHYITTFVISVILALAGLFSVFTLFWLASVPILLIVLLVCCFTYFVMISTSACNIVALVRKRQDTGVLFVAINAILQFIFVLDVIDTVYLCSRIKKNGFNL